MIRKFVAAAVIAAVCVTSVHGAPRSSSEQSRGFSALPDKAVVYIYRRTIIGAEARASIKVDDILVGATEGRSFFRLALPPGHHTIDSGTESTATLSMDVYAGQTYYVAQDIKFDVRMFRTGLRRVNASEGQADLRKLKLLATSAPQFGMTATTPAYAMAGTAMRSETLAPASVPAPASATSPATAAPVAATPPARMSAATAEPMPTAPADTASSDTASSGALQGSDLAVLDPRIDKAMFVAAQDLASSHQCERLLHVRTVDGSNAHLFSACPGSTTPIEILCNGASCHEGAPQG